MFRVGASAPVLLSRREVLGYTGRVAVSTIGLALAGGCTSLFATPSPKPVRVGVLAVASRADSERAFQAFLDRAATLGWRAGQNMIVEDRWGNGRRDVVVRAAAELANMPVDLIVAGGAAPIQDAKQVTSTIPIVMAGLSSDPVALGLIASLQRPGGNITGLSTFNPLMTSKQIELLKELIPGLRRVAALVTPDDPSKPQNVQAGQVAADSIGVEWQVEDVVLDDLPRAFEMARAWSADALLFIGDAVFATIVQPLVAQVTKVGLPSVFNDWRFVEAGGLISYGIDNATGWQRAADYMDKILRGTPPADLPVELPTTFELAVNSKTAQALGVTVPPDVAAQVTQWI